MTNEEHTSRPAALGLTALAVGFGIIGVAIGFATLLGISATASGGDDTIDYGPMAVTAASSLILGLLLIVGAALLWRAHRASRAVIGIGVALLVASSFARMALDSITFISVIGTVLSLMMLAAMGSLLFSDGVRQHVHEGIPLQLR